MAVRQALAWENGREMGRSIVKEGLKFGHLVRGLNDKMIDYLGIGWKRAAKRQSIKNEDCSPEVNENKEHDSDAMSPTPRSS